MLARRGEEPLLVPRMLEALRIDPKAVARRDPATSRDIQRVCAFCDSKKRCGRELDAGTAAVTFETYCPNALTLKALT
jgi:hypothetical protein